MESLGGRHGLHLDRRGLWWNMQVVVNFITDKNPEKCIWLCIMTKTSIHTAKCKHTNIWLKCSIILHKGIGRLWTSKLQSLGLHAGILIFLFIFQLLGECHCWWTKESPRAQVGKIYGRLRLIRSILRASNFSMLKLIEIVILWVYYTIPFGFNLFRHLLSITSQLFKLLCFAKDHWRGSSTQNVHLVHIIN